MEDFSSSLHTWYLQHKRDLPWRSDPSPYHIWLSEIILQQTRVDQGMAYYHRFVDVFPTVQDLANAELDEILRLWQGLGYYNRARNLHAAAKQVVEDFKGSFPQDYDGLLELKGVGPYTAAAIASIAYNQAKAVVDGNVIRVIARLYGIDAPVDRTSVLKEIQKKADVLLHPDKPGDHNQAMMELGALICSPKQPQCDACPVAIHCIALRQGTTQALPIKEKRTKRRSRYFHYVIPVLNGKTLIQQRDNKDIWASLFEFPLHETTADVALKNEQINDLLDGALEGVTRINAPKKHVLSHQDIHPRFYHVEVTDLRSSSARIVSLDDLHTFALPRLIDRYLENYRPNDGKKRH